MSETKIVWHPYPKEKPKRVGDYLVTINRAPDGKEIAVRYFDGAYFRFSSKKIEAWAELPEPYKPEADK